MTGGRGCHYCGAWPARARRDGEPPTCIAHADLPQLELGDREQRELEQRELERSARALERRDHLHSRR